MELVFLALLILLMAVIALYPLAGTWNFNELAVWAPLPRQFGIQRVSLAGTLDLEARNISASNVGLYRAQKARGLNTGKMQGIACV